MASEKKRTDGKTERKAVALQTVQADYELACRELGELVRTIDGAAWKDVSEVLQTLALVLDSVRFSAQRILFDRRPERLAFRARELSQLFATWADRLDDPELPTAEREHLVGVVSAMKVAVSRAHTGLPPGARDETFLRTVLCETVQRVADAARKGAWKNLVSEQGAARWLVLADEVIRLYCDGVDPAHRELMVKQRRTIARAVQACSNVGGRGKRPEFSKDGAIIDVCEALGFPPAEYDSIRKSRRRSAKK